MPMLLVLGTVTRVPFCSVGNVRAYKSFISSITTMLEVDGLKLPTPTYYTGCSENLCSSVNFYVAQIGDR
jgi:hypothetical protein